MSVKVLFCYAHEDEIILNKLQGYLKPLERNGLIEMWDDRKINAGAIRKEEISQHLNTAQLIILLISSYFMESEYCYETELKPALGRHQRKEARVVPVVIRPVHWPEELSHLQALPKNTLPITDPGWRDINIALYNVTEDLRAVIAELILPSSSPNILSSKGEHQEQESQPLTLLHAPVDSTSQKQSHPFSFFYRTHTRRAVLLAGIVLTGGGMTWLALVKNAPTTPGTSVNRTPILPLQARTLRIYRNHSQNVQSVAWPLQNTQIASASQDHTVQVWNTQTGEPLLIYQGVEAFWSVTWSPNGKQLASACSDHKVYLWDIQKKNGPLFTYTGHTEAVWSVVWSPNGKWLASASGDHTVRVWDAQTGDLLLTYTGHSTSVWSIAWSPDSKRLASASGDHTVQIWDAQTDKNPLFTYTGHTQSVKAVAWSPNGKWLASAGEDHTVQIWGI